MIYRTWIYLAAAVLVGIVFAAAVPTLVKAHSLSMRAALMPIINERKSGTSAEPLESPQVPDAAMIL